MKKLLLFLIVPISSFAQAKFNGLGVFKIGSSQQQVDSIIAINNISVDSVSVSQALRIKDYKTISKVASFDIDTKMRVFKYQKDTIDVSYGEEEVIILPGVSVFKINHFEIGEYKISNIRLYYNEKILYKISFDGNIDLNDAIKLKYGAPEVKEISSEVKCIYKLTGNTTIEKDQTFFQTWRSDADVLARLIVGVYHDDNCKKNYINSWDIAETQIDKANRALTAELRTIIESNKQKAKDLSGL